MTTRLSAASARKGAVLMALGVFCFTSMDAVAKGLIAHYPTIEVIWARFAGHFLLVVLYLGGRLQFIIRAFSVAEAGVLAPFGYLDIIFATAWSIFAFGDYPDRYTILGALVIIAAGLYVWRQETLGANPKPVV